MPSGTLTAAITGSARQQDAMTAHAEAVDRQHAQAEAQSPSNDEKEQNKLRDLLDKLASNALTWQVFEHVIVASGLVECSVQQGHFVLTMRQSPYMPLRKIIHPSTDYGVYPQTTIYVKIGERRFVGTESIEVTASLIEYLRNEEKASIAWSAWPYRGQLSDEIYLDGLSDALAKCESFMEENKQN